LRELPANVALRLMDALLDAFPLAMHAAVTPLNPCLFHHAVNVPRLEGFILILLFFLAIVIPPF